MSTIAHFINVGQGNMTLLELADGTIMLYDCNVTDENEQRVLAYFGGILGRGSIDIFVNSHRDADHMRGIKRVHARFPIKKVWDSGVTGGTPDCREYREYMDLRRQVGFRTVEAKKRWDFGATRIRVMNAENDELPDNANAQSIVMKVENHGTGMSSLMLTGDSDACTWRYAILERYTAEDLASDILLGSHHGSITFFDDPADEKHYYVDHMKSINPAMTVLSVGPNSYGHPEDKAVELYEKYSRGSNKGNRLYRTDDDGTIKLTLKDDGGWSMTRGQQVPLRRVG